MNNVEATLSLSIENLTNDDGEPADNAKYEFISYLQIS